MQFHFQPIAANATNESLQVQLFKEWIYLTQVQQLGAPAQYHTT